MDQFIAQILAKLDTRQAEADLKSITDKKYQIDVELNLTNKSLDVNKILSGLESSFKTSGQNIGKSFNTGLQSGMSTSKFDGHTYIKNYLDGLKRDQKEAESVAKQFNVSQNNALKAVKSRNSAETKANNENIKQQQQQQKELESIEKARLKSIEDSKKREEKTILNQNKAINKQLENDYKQQQKEQQKLTEQNLKQISKSEQNSKKIQAQQRIAELKSNAVQKNAHNGQLIQQGKDNIVKWKQQYKDSQDDANSRALVEAYKQASEYQKNEEEYLIQRNKYLAEGKKQAQEYYSEQQQNLKSINNSEQSWKKIQAQQKIAELQNNAIQKNAHTNELVNQGKSNIEKWKQQYQDQSKYIEKINELNERSTKISNTFLDDSFKQKYGNTSGYSKVIDNLEKVKTLQSEVNAEIEKGSSADFNKVNNGLKEMNSLISKSETQYSNLSKPIGVLDSTIASNKTLNWLKENSKASKELGDAFEVLAKKQKTATTSGELESYNKEFNSLVNIAKQKGLTGKSWFDEGKRAFTQIAEFTGMYGLAQNLMQDLPREMVQAVYDVDTAMTNLYKVTDETSAKYNEFLDSAGTKAKELGRDMSSYIEQTANWSKLGYSLDQAAELSKVSSIYANVGEVDDATAVSDIVTAMKAFNIEAENSITIIDQLNALGKFIAHVYSNIYLVSSYIG